MSQIFKEKLDFSKKIEISAIRAGIIFMQIKYNDPGSNLSLQTFVHKNIHFYFLIVMVFDDFSRFPDSFWWISMDLRVAPRKSTLKSSIFV